MNIGKPNPANQRFTQYQVRSQNDRITIQDPNDPKRLAGSMQVSAEQIDVFTSGRQFQVNMGPEGVTVSDPASAGTRGVYDMVLPTSLKPEQYRGTGLAVAFALMGLPLPPQIVQESPPRQADPLHFEVSVKNSKGPGLARYEVRQQGNQITVGDPRERMQRGAMELSQPDQINLYANQRQYRIQMNPEGVRVDNPKSDGMRGGMADLILSTPLRPEDYQRTGLSVAFSLLGLPLPPHFAG